MTKFFKKSKKPYFRAILGLFHSNWAKMNFPGKDNPTDFRYSNYLQSCQKSEKSNEPFLRKTPN